MALYRKYRPATFAEVVGQEHVTEPLSTALAAGRINHATCSRPTWLRQDLLGAHPRPLAELRARSHPAPCGVCDSCVSLGTGGSGSIDVVELDAASHGGVDDTRELRDCAFYAPAQSRYRIFIVDEAHMVTTAGFNALLKIVEEPPEHLIFVFATTEPEKVLPTIRSRTHHYPFRLLAPRTMRGLIERILDSEHVDVDDAVFPLVIRAGGGSPRDTLSVLDQLLAGAQDNQVHYQRALALLRATDVALIDDAVDALAAGDAAALFGAVESVIDAGHDPVGSPPTCSNVSATSSSCRRFQMPPAAAWWMPRRRIGPDARPGSSHRVGHAGPVRRGGARAWAKCVGHRSATAA